MQENRSNYFPFLIIGSGVAGLALADELSNIDSTCIITKQSLKESATSYAQGGIAAALGEMDLPERHLRDTLEAGAGLCDEQAVKILCYEGIKRTQAIIEGGMPFTKDPEGKLHMVREAGHSDSRILHVNDQTGKTVVDFLYKKVSDKKNITIFENTIAVDLITEYQIEKDQKASQCYGAYAMDTRTEEIKTFFADYICLATGGVGQVYSVTTNPKVCTGDGIAMAYRAGCRIRNMEFIQFHPTTLYSDRNPAFLITEALRGFEATLTLQSGKKFMAKYHPKEELAPRDIVARAIDFELKKTGEKFVYLNAYHKEESEIKKFFPTIYNKLLKDFKLDITKQPVPVAPAAHYLCGGILVDLNSRSDLDFLYALGECASTGVHGANRLASNSILEALVFAHRAMASIQNDFSQGKHKPKKKKYPHIPEWNELNTKTATERVIISHDNEEIKEIMQDYVGIVRSNLKLSRAIKRIDIIYEEIIQYYCQVKLSQELIELRNIAVTAQLIIRSALKRKESRGLHYNIDYPENRETSREDTIIIPKISKFL